MPGDSNEALAAVQAGTAVPEASQERMQDIAREVGRLRAAVRGLGPTLAFEDEPAHFGALLERRAR